MEIIKLIKKPIEKVKLPVYILYWEYCEDKNRHITSYENLKSEVYNTSKGSVHSYSKIIHIPV